MNPSDVNGLLNNSYVVNYFALPPRVGRLPLRVRTISLGTVVTEGQRRKGH
jgi:hypothetical protein